MQSNTSSWLSWLSSLKKIGGLLKFLLLLVLLGYLYKTIESKGQSWRDIRDLLATNLNARHGLELVMVVFLTPINWACESRKWQLLAQKIEQISFYAAFKGVLAGLALGFMMPNNVGDAAGRILSLQSEQRLSGVGAALLANGLQFYVSLLFGTWGWGYFLWQQPQVRTWPQYLLFGLLLMTLLFGLWMIFNRKNAEKYLERFRWFRWVEPYVDVITQYQLREIYAAFRWAVLRYMVFTLQFSLLLFTFEVELSPMSMLSSIFLVFFAKTLLPALNFLGDLGIREASSLYFFSFYTVEPARIVAVTLTLWGINIFFPVLIGMFWVMKAKWWR